MRALLAFFAALPALAAAPPRPVDFQREIRPILSDKCFQCHGPDESKRMANLRLDLAPGAPLLVPGKAAESKIWQRISHAKKPLRMPPPASGLTLTAAEMALIERWIDEGGAYQVHWAFLPPQRQDPPAAAAAAWNRNPIDRFIHARLAREGLKPSPRASRETLIRRLSLDLTGLPPTPGEVRDFLNDRSPGAYEKLVDRLLASPHYGERMAMQWLDLARYADTHGYHIDSHRDMWPWRDWVISAFNRNLNFKDFIEWQIAGDLMPDATREMKIASGFNRNHMINFEGGAIPEEYQVEYVRDRVDTTSTTFLGLTVACAKCHDHKYDPITQKEYYKLAAFFNTVAEKGLDGTRGNAAPMLPLPTPEQEQRAAELKAALAGASARLPEPAVSIGRFLFEKQHFGKIPPSPLEALEAWYELDGSFSDISGRHRHGLVLKGEPVFGEGIAGRGLPMDASYHIRFPGESLRAGSPFSLALWVRFGRNPGMSVLQQFESSARGFEVRLGESRVLPQYRRGQKLEFLWRDGASVHHVRTREWLLQNKPTHVLLTSAGPADSLRLFIDGEPAGLEVVTSGELHSYTAPIEAGNKQWGDSTFRGLLDDLRVYSRPLSAAEAVQLAVDYPALLEVNRITKRSRDRDQALTAYYLTRHAPAEWRAAYQDWKRLKKAQEELDASIVTTMVMSEMEKPRETFVLRRGDYASPGDKVEPGVPSALPPLPADVKPDRLALAKWLTDPANPLTARVTVNRFWQMYFGHGIVKTSEDFGSQGEPPVHAELLDWLATEFIRTGWDVKAMQRLIVTSEAYRQVSKVTPALHEKDPENRLLARGPRVRLQAELIRDNALAVSGLLRPAIGGPSVLPYQPPGLWEELAFGEEFTAQEYHQDHGDKLWRRSMYTFWKRTVPPATMSTFDAPDREKCVAKRSVTNTPLQALAVLNDPTFLEAARVLAARVLREEPASDDARLSHAFFLVAAREPGAAERKVLRESLQSMKRAYARDEAAARKLLSVGEAPLPEDVPPPVLAAWANVCSILLNTDEAITKE